jgi:hypothetical protein
MRGPQEPADKNLVTVRERFFPVIPESALRATLGILARTFDAEVQPASVSG